MIKCDNCGFIADEKYNFCPNCGSALKKNGSATSQFFQDNNLKKGIVVCDVCGENTTKEKGFCVNCGAKLTGREKAAEIKEETADKISASADKISKEKNQEKPKSKVIGTKSKERQKKQSIDSAGKKTLTNIQIILISGSMLVVVFIILFASGVFETDQVNNISGKSGSSSESAIDLGQLQEINKLEKAVNSDTTNLNNVLELAHRLNDAGFYEKAIGYYQMYLRHSTKNPDVQIDLGVCYFELKRYDKAKEEMLKGIKIDPKHQIGLFNLGVVSLAQGDLDSAKYWWKRTLDINENSDIAKKAKQLLESH